MIEISIKLEELERVLQALKVETPEDIKAELVNYLNSRVYESERDDAIQKTISLYKFKPLVVVPDEPPVEDSDEPPIEDPPVEDLEELIE